MTLGKNKGIQKKGAKLRKNDRHPFTKKEWFKLITAPTFGAPKAGGWIPCNTTIGKKRAEENVLGRVCEMTYTDINEDSKFHWRKVKMEVEKVEGGNLYSSFGGMSCTRERIMSQIKKRQTIITVWADVKTGDGYILRVGCTLLTKNVPGQKKKNSYAKSSEVKRIRKLVTKILTEQAAKSTTDHFASNILSDNLPEQLIKEANRIFPVRVCIITKVKVLKKSKIDVGKLVEASQGAKGESTPFEQAGAAQNALSKEREELKAKQDA